MREEPAEPELLLRESVMAETEPTPTPEPYSAPPLTETCGHEMLREARANLTKARLISARSIEGLRVPERSAPAR